MARSLRRTLLLWLLLPLAGIVPVALALQYRLVLRPAQEAFDQALANAAITVAGFVREDAAGRLTFEMSAQAERSLRTDAVDTIYYAVLGPDGRRLAGDPMLEPPAAAPAAEATVFIDTQIEGQPVRVAVRGLACGSGTCQARVAETLAKRQRVERDSLSGALAAVLAVALAAGLTIVLATRQALVPLTRLSAQVGQRNLDDLRELQAGDAPRELQGLVDAMNRLFGRVREGSLAQQAFLADAAHQMRTPLAALQTEAELALAAPHPPEMAPTLERLRAGATRAARSASQLLALARSDSAARAALPTEALDLKTLVADAADEWVGRAIAAGVDLGFELQPAPLQGQRFLLRELLANLLHNALEYGARQVTVRTLRDGADAVLEIDDDGPGIPAADRERVFQRFTRGADAPGSGSGLGLAIVRDIAQGHGGSVRLADAPGRGLRVQVRLPS